jgi:hypothetical protein
MVNASAVSSVLCGKLSQLVASTNYNLSTKTMCEPEVQPGRLLACLVCLAKSATFLKY